MRIPIFRALTALVVAASAAGCGADAPTETTAAGGASLSTGALAVSANCIDTGNLYSSQRFDCTATASGGTGAYSFTWSGNGVEYYDAGGTSKAWYPCQYVPGSYGYGYLAATAIAFDGVSHVGKMYNKQPC